MTPAQVAHIMALVEAYADSTHISSHENCLAARAAVEAALRDAPQAEPPLSCNKVPPGNGYCDQCAKGLYEQCRYTTPSAPQQAEGWVRVPVDVLKAASESLGSFVSDHGWGDADMQAMDNLDAYLAARPSAPTAVEPDEPLKWCSYCGEGVTTFCRGKQSPDWDYKCPVLNLPARASKGTK